MYLEKEEMRVNIRKKERERHFKSIDQTKSEEKELCGKGISILAINILLLGSVSSFSILFQKDIFRNLNDKSVKTGLTITVMKFD